MPSHDSDNPLAAEILQETAAAYFDSCRKMVASLEALKTFDRAFAGAEASTADGVRRSKLLDEAADRVYSVVVQRDAMKLSCFEEFFEDYSVPHEVRTRLGRWRGT